MLENHFILVVNLPSGGFSKLVHGEHPDDDSFWPNGKKPFLLKEIDNYNDFDRRSIDKDVELNLAKNEAKISDIQKSQNFLIGWDT